MIMMMINGFEMLKFFSAVRAVFFGCAGSAAADQCTGGDTWRVFCYGIITAMCFFALIALVTIVALRPGCRRTCARRKSYVENQLHTSGLYLSVNQSVARNLYA